MPMKGLAVWRGAGLALMLFFAATAAAQAASFTARGNEPFWRIEITEEGISFQDMEGKTFIVSPKPEPETAEGVETFRAEVDGQPFSLTVTDKICVDTMSGMPHPKTVALTHGERALSGCGGEPASLLHGEWSILEIGGKDLVPESKPTLAFDPDGRVYGHGSCNRYFGNFKLTGEGLSVSPLGSTQMACDQALMDQEYAFHQILEKISRFEIDADGKLILHTDDGRTVVGTRAEKPDGADEADKPDKPAE
jgi:heat shock protein HslJ